MGLQYIDSFRRKFILYMKATADYLPADGFGDNPMLRRFLAKTILEINFFKLKRPLDSIPNNNINKKQKLLYADKTKSKPDKDNKKSVQKTNASPSIKRSFCVFNIFKTLGIKNNVGKIMSCTRQNCNIPHKSLNELNKQEALDNVNGLSVKLKNMYESAINALPISSFKS